MDRIKTQWGKLWQIISQPKTYTTYKEAGQVTWAILQETGLLAWLGICLLLVMLEWFWKTAIGSGRNFRNWFNNLEGSSDQIASETGKALLSAGKNSLDFTINTAKSQLGLPIDKEK
ncbi:hypothetical protein [Leptodesmis sichuanensis]|uniref:hypothetical protein n=1 Tax=Leptodesmis sichuanensis TaxID=2906798 RepID=UPI001F1FAE30|nr:hypothetical protein [Leptodesmis sichuanensis]UIE38645.1 hypothetical protein KIK02_03150 [Leptodesmis sichuanensis A121]